MKQISTDSFHSKSTIAKHLKGQGVFLRAAGHHHGNPSQLRFGYKKASGLVLPHMGEQYVVNMIKDFRSDGLTYRKVAERLTALGIPSKNGKFEWHPMMVKRVMDFHELKS